MVQDILSKQTQEETSSFLSILITGQLLTVHLYFSIQISHYGTPAIPFRKLFNALIDVLITLFIFRYHTIVFFIISLTT